MTIEQAIKKLTAILESGSLSDVVDDAEQTATDLCDWLNTTDFSRSDLARLVNLVKSERFDAWDCPTCDDGTRVYVADPEDWSHFQGALSADYVSYPGLGIGEDDKRCDHCRMYMVGNYVPEGYHVEAD